VQNLRSFNPDHIMTYMCATNKSAVITDAR